MTQKRKETVDREATESIKGLETKMNGQVKWSFFHQFQAGRVYSMINNGRWEEEIERD